ncbi:MAG: DUF2232 domain-containing protein [Thermosynechococcus sp. Uc]|uniref:DUF2232 domain-containing protein n=1 Tax=Thermosynechococcus sp. Uc TaxID=3034853 RepID=UPI0019EAA48E|nr:DUF2232 domain-containing protein [Thermosynechococcus sp. Uc]MDM7326941.1 DUF2232 domain-containing protein [Thermosynechococcus sp. Uc]HIK24742.1 DUF2232 domain-containing protein [Thermosynechococcus sp. M46_R2017_013]
MKPTDSLEDDFPDVEAIVPPEQSSALGRSQIQRTLVITETAFLASTAALLWVINFYLPIGPVLRLFFPIPIALVYLRWNRRAAWMAAIVSALLLSVLMGPPRSLQFLLPHGMMGVIFGGCWAKKEGWGRSILGGAVVGTAGFFFQISLVSILLGENLWIYFNQQVTNFIDWVLVNLNLLLEPTVTLIQVVALLLVFFQSMVYALVVHILAWTLLERLGNPIPDPPPWLRTILEDPR